MAWTEPTQAPPAGAGSGLYTGAIIEKMFILNNFDTSNPSQTLAACVYVNGSLVGGEQENYPFSSSSSVKNQKCICSEGYSEQFISIWNSGDGGWSTCGPAGCRNMACIKF